MSTENQDGWKEVSISSEIWDREKPIMGRLVDVRDDVGPNGSKMYTILTDEGEVGVWGSTVLDTKLSKVDKGSFVKIEPLGEAKAERSGRTYQDFAVFYKEAPKITEDDGKPIDLSEIPF